MSPAVSRTGWVWIDSAELAYIILLSIQWIVYSWTFIKTNEKARNVIIILRHPDWDCVCVCVCVCVFMCMYACCACVCVSTPQKFVSSFN